MNIFSMDNAFFRFMGKLTDLLWLNILTLICCIPVFTAGAAFSAMYYILIHMTLKQDTGITKVFFRVFKENFKNSTIVWVPSFLVLVALFANGYLIYHGTLEGYSKLTIASGLSIGAIAAIVILFLNYVLSMISRYDTELKNNVKNAFLLMAAYAPRSFCILMITLAPIALMMISDNFLYFWFIYGFSFPGYVNAMLLGDIFVKTEDATGNGQDELGEI